MVREISAGGVVVRNKDGDWWMAAIELPAAKPAAVPGSEVTPKRRSKPASMPKAVLCLPKGLVDAGEKPLEAALREVREETGITALPVLKLADIKYVYVRSWGDGERVFKIVSFYLLRYDSGTIDEVAPAMRVEVKRALWIPLEEAERRLTYRGEKEVIRLAKKYLELQSLNSHAEEAN